MQLNLPKKRKDYLLFGVIAGVVLAIVIYLVVSGVFEAPSSIRGQAVKILQLVR